MTTKKCSDCNHSDLDHMDEAGDFISCWPCGCPQFFYVYSREKNK